MASPLIVIVRIKLDSFIILSMINPTMNDYLKMKWRTGRKVGRTVYAQMGESADDIDPLIGVFDSVELAKEAVESHNSRLS